MLADEKLVQNVREEETLKKLKNMRNAKEMMELKPIVTNKFKIKFNHSLWQQLKNHYFSIDNCEPPNQPFLNIENVTYASILVCFCNHTLMFHVLYFFFLFFLCE